MKKSQVGNESQLKVECKDHNKNTPCSCYVNRESSSSKYHEDLGEEIYTSYKNTHPKWRDFSFMKREDGCVLDSGNEDKFQITALCGES